ncbi:hypothetical protein APUTEX25_001249 [Auxenochlorella protothecoides]|uniref:Sialidase domain-containing protein n=1 Tax=Auxenochlorella protothecoides TaxID=3075 RepID=A0A3M7KQM3_AUXPR|nr:hypothetical protein APUTEX25_001249 [Auxenochlorella protothecoides]|eukprot:RMZ52055.1 hypothetical protein APUTEX25_001249 [Auxenochlorella protothecoides]
MYWGLHRVSHYLWLSSPALPEHGSYSIGYLDDRFQFRDPANQLIGGKGQNDSQFEGIAYVPEDDTFLLLHESQEHEGGYKPFVTTARLSKDGKEYERLSKCVVDFELTHENKGFEGMAYVKNSKGEIWAATEQHTAVPISGCRLALLAARWSSMPQASHISAMLLEHVLPVAGAFLLGLCEGNFCEGGRRGRKSGNGRIIILQLDTDDNGCRWVKKDVLDIPKEANFIDYSAMAIDYNLGRIAILSQENAAFWVADFDIESLDFVGTGSIVHLPRNEHCEIVYCNAEGIQWIDAYRVIVVSDRAKATQPYHCDEHDQSVHIFGLPGAASKASPAIDWE